MSNIMKYIIATLIVSISSLSAQDCTDDVTGALLAFGGCAVMAPGFGCDGEGFGVLISEECPL
ncbi:uncharacterized protein METZ01_LOCUS426437, partial [marine metagenome]